MNDVITIIVPINAKPECKEQVKAKLTALAAFTRQEAGNICYRLHQKFDNDNQFIIYEQWKNQKALDFHMSQDYLQNFLTESKSLLSEEIKGLICKEI